VVTPEAAANSLALLNEHIVPPPTSGSLPGGVAELAYRIVDIPGKGLGVVAARRIARNEVFMTDYAALVIDMELPSSVRPEVGYGLLHAATEQLANPDQVRSLDKSNKEARDEIEAVIRTNAFHASLGGIPHMALFPDVSVS
jgi:hypothetical protein